MLEAVKLALRIKTDAFNEELNLLINAGKKDLECACNQAVSESDILVKRAIITYVKANFGSPDNYERLKRSYDEQKAQLKAKSR